MSIPACAPRTFPFIPLRRRSALWLAAVLLLAGACAAGSLRAATEEELNQRFAEANLKLQAKDYAEAIELYNDILEQEPKSDNVWINRAIAKAGLSDISGARVDLAMAISLNPESVEAYRYRAVLRFQAEDFAGSVADLDAAIRLVPDNAGFFEMRGEVHRRLENPGDALADFSRAIELEPGFVQARLHRAEIQREREHDTAAQADYDRVIELAPDTALAWKERGWIKFRRQDLAGALADGLKSRELQSKVADSFRLTGYAQFGLGDYPAAIATLTQAAELEKENAAYPLFIRHFAQLRTGGADTRLATFWAGQTVDNWAHAVARYVTGQITEDRLEQLADGAMEADTRLGHHCEAHFYIGLMRLQAGDSSTARLRFRSALATKQVDFTEHALAAAELKRL